MKKVVKIKPNSNKEIEMFGLEQYGEVMFPNVDHEYYVATIPIIGTDKYKYVTGLDETAPSIVSLPDKERIEKIRWIREMASDIYYKMNNIKVDPDDEHFWEKCSILLPHNSSVWGKLKLKINNLGRMLNLDVVEDLLLYCVIKGGGIPEVAISIDIAKTDYEKFKFYLDEGAEFDYNVRTKKTKTKAYSLLNELVEDTTDESLRKMRYLVTILVPVQYQSKVAGETEKDFYLQVLDNYINGLSGIKESRAIDLFLDTFDKDLRKLSVAALITDLINNGEATILEDRTVFIKDFDIKLLSQDIWENVNYLLSSAFYKKFKDIVLAYKSKKNLWLEDLLPEEMKSNSTTNTDSNKQEDLVIESGDNDELAILKNKKFKKPTK